MGDYGRRCGPTEERGTGDRHLGRVHPWVERPAWWVRQGRQSKRKNKLGLNFCEAIISAVTLVWVACAPGDRKDFTSPKPFSPFAQPA